MTGYKSKRAAAQDKLAQPAQDALMQSLKDLKRSVCDEVGKAAFAHPAQEPASVTYKEVQDSMNALEKGNLYQQVIAEELGQRKLYTTPPSAQPAQEPVCPECKAGVLYECVACSSNNYPPKPAQETALEKI